MAGHGALLVRLTATAAALESPRSPAGRLCQAACALADADGGALTLEEGPEGLGREVLWATDSVARLLDDLHDTLGEGPAVEALRANTPVSVSVENDGHARWPLFADAARDAGARLVVALPMHANGHAAGVLLLYRARAGAFALPPADLEFLAEAVGLVLVQAGGAPDDAEGTAHSAVDQAVGMVMTEQGLSALDALSLLRAHAFARGLPLAEVARRVLDHTLTLRPDRPQ